MTEDVVKTMMEKMQQTISDQIHKVMANTTAEMSKLQRAGHGRDSDVADRVRNGEDTKQMKELA